MHTTRRRFMAGMAAAPLLAAQRTIGSTTQPASTNAERLIVISLDGVRSQELFGGMDRAVLQAQLGKRPVEEHPHFKAFWRDTRESRRAALLPFFWNTFVKEHASVVGDQAAGSVMRLGNTQRFSYPGYSELMLGVVHDTEIDSNDNRRYPYDTVLQFLRRQLRAPQQDVACLASWEVFQSICASREGEVFVNAGLTPYESADPAMRRVSELQFEAKAWDSARMDAFTWAFARDYLARVRPRALWISLNDSDEWAHQRNYVRTLEHLHRFDGWLSELWTWLQGDATYKGRTALAIVTDHGRGLTTADWGNHGKDVEGAQDVWAAFAVPAWKTRGVWRSGHQPASQSQIAATLAGVMGLDWRAASPKAGAALLPPGE